ncbi:MAG: hypothetical protein FK733_15950 [Asgard group archaeon]|nr:hypothetical protein [Asgard group archaeon]
MNRVRVNRIYNLVNADPAKIAILTLLADGNCHTRFEVENSAKEFRPTIGVVGVCTIMNALQEADSELLEVYDNDSGVFYRLNPQRTSLIRQIITHLKGKPGQKGTATTSSSQQYMKFKERLKTTRKKTGSFDEDLKQFL